MITAFRLLSWKIGDTAVDYIKTIEPSGSNAVNPEPLPQNLEPIKKMKKSTEMWKEKYFESIVTVEEKCGDVEIQKSRLKAYRTLLQCMQLEQGMGIIISLFPFNISS